MSVKAQYCHSAVLTPLAGLAEVYALVVGQVSANSRFVYNKRNVSYLMKATLINLDII